MILFNLVYNKIVTCLKILSPLDKVFFFSTSAA